MSGRSIDALLLSVGCEGFSKKYCAVHALVRQFVFEVALAHPTNFQPFPIPPLGHAMSIIEDGAKKNGLPIVKSTIRMKK
jgi:hypothetical protein